MCISVSKSMYVCVCFSYCIILNINDTKNLTGHPMGVDRFTKIVVDRPNKKRDVAEMACEFTVMCAPTKIFSSSCKV